jgi:hypothetical protein
LALLVRKDFKAYKALPALSDPRGFKVLRVFKVLLGLPVRKAFKAYKVLLVVRALKVQ